MAQRIILNKRDKTIKIVNRKNSIRLTHTGNKGPIGPVGPAGSIEIGDTTTLAPGLDATVVNVGTETAAILEFGIPEGIQGDTPLAIQPEAPAETDWLWVDTDDDGHDVYTEIDRVEGLLDTHTSDIDNPHSVTKTQVGLSNVDNTSDISKPVSSATQTALSNKADLVGGKVPESQLPSFVDDVLTYPDLASFPATGENGKIYITEDTNLTYRWSGSDYTEISPSLALGETSSTAYRGDRGKTAYDHSLRTDNPHGVTKAQVGLGNSDDTSDVDKPISTAAQTALNTKVDKSATANVAYVTDAFGAQTTLNYRSIVSPNSLALRNASSQLLVGAPTANDHATTKLYVDTQNALYFLKSGDTATGQFVLAPATAPSNGAFRLLQKADNADNGISVVNAAVNSSARLWVNGTNFVLTNNSQNLVFTATSLLGINTTPTHTLTLPSTATGIALYNTVDQTTNYERVRQYWSSNIWSIASEAGGSAPTRDIQMSAFGSSIFTLGGASTNTVATFSRNGTALDLFRVTSTGMIKNIGIQYGIRIDPTINQSATAGYTAILANVTETSTGSGAKLLLDLEVGSVTKFSVDNTGYVTALSIPNSNVTKITINSSAPPTPSINDIWIQV